MCSFSSQKPATVYGGKEPILPFAESELVQAEIATWRRLSAESGDCKAVYEVTLDTKVIYIMCGLSKLLY